MSSKAMMLVVVMVVMTFVIVVVSVMVFGQVLVWVFLEGILATGGAKVVGFARVFALVLRGFDFNFHLANGVNGNGHGILLLKS